MAGTFEDNVNGLGSASWYCRYQSLLEWAFWPILFSVLASLDASSVVMEYTRRSIPLDNWEPYVWEYSSVASAMLGVWLIIQFDRRFPLTSQYLWRNLVAHAMFRFSLVYSAVHVIGMVFIRELVYQQAGRQYDFGNWAFEAWYEYRKDALTYLSVMARLFVGGRSSFAPPSILFSGVGAQPPSKMSEKIQRSTMLIDPLQAR